MCCCIELDVHGVITASFAFLVLEIIGVLHADNFLVETVFEHIHAAVDADCVGIAGVVADLGFLAVGVAADGAELVDARSQVVVLAHQETLAPHFAAVESTVVQTLVVSQLFRFIFHLSLWSFGYFLVGKVHDTSARPWGFRLLFLHGSHLEQEFEFWRGHG